jgi:hypothetical protein
MLHQMLAQNYQNSVKFVFWNSNSGIGSANSIVVFQHSGQEFFVSKVIVPFSVNLMALLIKFKNICRNLMSSPKTIF